MKQVTLVVLLFSSLAIAAGNRNPPDYNVTVHVVASRMVLHHAYYQQLSAVIDGKNYELESRGMEFGFLLPGDYKARLVEDRHSRSYDVWQVYEFLFPDNKTRQFLVLEIKQ